MQPTDAESSPLPVFLQHKAAEFGKQGVIVNEAYTSKTYCWNGERIPNLGRRCGRRVPGSGRQRRTRDFPACFGRYPLVAGPLQPASRAT